MGISRWVCAPSGLCRLTLSWLSHGPWRPARAGRQRLSRAAASPLPPNKTRSVFNCLEIVLAAYFPSRLWIKPVPSFRGNCGELLSLINMRSLSVATLVSGASWRRVLSALPPAPSQGEGAPVSPTQAQRWRGGSRSDPPSVLRARPSGETRLENRAFHPRAHGRGWENVRWSKFGK